MVDVVKSYAVEEGSLPVMAKEGQLKVGCLYFIHASPFLSTTPYTYERLGGASWTTIEDMPAFVAAGDTQEAARLAIHAMDASWRPTWGEIQERPAFIAAGGSAEEVRQTLGLGSAAEKDAEDFIQEIKSVNGVPLEGTGDVTVGIRGVRQVSQTATAVPGFLHNVSQQGVTLNMPTLPQVGDRVGFCNTSAGDIFVNWAGRSVKNVLPNPPAMRVPPLGTAYVMFDGETWL